MTNEQRREDSGAEDHQHVHRPPEHVADVDGFEAHDRLGREHRDRVESDASPIDYGQHNGHGHQDEREPRVVVEPRAGSHSNSTL